jgi:cytochrome c
MDSFELNKIMGAVLGTLLFTLSLSIVAGGIFAAHSPAKPGYEIAAKEEKGAAQAAAEPQVPFENLLAEANADRGANVARQCVACHEFTKGGPNKVGPNLYGIVNRDKATVPGFAYSAAMKAKGGQWTFDELNKYLENPSKHVPGTSMTFLGIRRGPDRAAVIAYLNKSSDAPAELPKPQAAAPADAQKKDAPPAVPAKDAPKKDAEKKGAAPAAPVATPPATTPPAAAPQTPPAAAPQTPAAPATPPAVAPDGQKK